MESGGRTTKMIEYDTCEKLTEAGKCTGNPSETPQGQAPTDRRFLFLDTHQTAISRVSIISSPRSRLFFPSLLILCFSNGIDHRHDDPTILKTDRFYSHHLSLPFLISMTNKTDRAVGVLASAGKRVSAFHLCMLLGCPSRGSHDDYMKL